MTKSEQINELAAALAKAQAKFQPIEKTGFNPFLKNRYVTLDGIIEMTRKPLSDAGLAYVQLLGSDGESLPTLTTILMHDSGQWISATMTVRAVVGKGTNELQELGRSITYIKRYTLAAMLGVSSDEDTDGNGPKPQRKPAPSPKAVSSPEPLSKRQKLEERWAELWAEAQALHLEPDNLPSIDPKMTDAELTESGKALAAIVEAARASAQEANDG